jgi:hypothetical protein
MKLAEAAKFHRKSGVARRDLLLTLNVSMAPKQAR